MVVGVGDEDMARVVDVHSKGVDEVACDGLPSGSVGIHCDDGVSRGAQDEEVPCLVNFDLVRRTDGVHENCCRVATTAVRGQFDDLVVPGIRNVDVARAIGSHSLGPVQGSSPDSWSNGDLGTVGENFDDLIVVGVSDMDVVG